MRTKAVIDFLLGLAAIVPSAVPTSGALHALTAGAIGTMTLAVMTRATRGHTGRAIIADPVTKLIYGLVTLGAVLRVAAPFLGAMYPAALIAGGIVWSSAVPTGLQRYGDFWSGAFLLFACAYAPMLFRKRAAA